MYSKTASKPKRVKKENNLDYLVSVSDSLFQGYKDADTSEDRKEKFLKENMKPSEVIPRKNIKNRETPDNFGYMNTRFGFLEIWYKKYRRNSHIVVSLVPKSAESLRGMSEQEADSPHYYFGGDSNKKRKRKTLSSEIGFEYDPQESEIKKLRDDGDGELDTEDELLYTNTREEYMIENLKNRRSHKNVDRADINRRIEKMKDIKEEKKEDNEEFLKLIMDFVKKMKNGRIRRKVESDEAKSRRERIVSLSQNIKSRELGIIELKKRLEELSKEKECKQELLELLTDFVCKAEAEKAYSEVYAFETKKEEKLAGSPKIDLQELDIVELKKRLEELWKEKGSREKILDLVTNAIQKMKKEE